MNENLKTDYCLESQYIDSEKMKRFYEIHQNLFLEFLYAYSLYKNATLNNDYIEEIDREVIPDEELLDKAEARKRKGCIAATRKLLYCSKMSKKPFIKIYVSFSNISECQEIIDSAFEAIKKWDKSRLNNIKATKALLEQIFNS